MVSADLKYKEFIVERPFAGYGMTPPDVKWPKGAKVAVNFVIEYTEGGESSVEYGDAHSENLFVDLCNIPHRPARDDMVESEWEFGPRAGLPRIMRMFNKYGMKATVNVVTSALEKAPYWAKQLTSSGMELSCASSRWIDYLHVAPEVEEQHILASIKSLQEMTGDESLPKGWCVGRRSNVSQRLYARANKELGLELKYSADSFGDDLPYWITSPLAEEGEKDEGLLIVPSSLDCSDFRFNAKGQGWSSGQDFYTYLVDTLETLYEEGVEGEAKMMTVQLHPHIIGRAGRLAFLDKFLAVIASKGDNVWVATREEIADFWRAEYPYDAAAAHGKLPVA